MIARNYSEIIDKLDLKKSVLDPINLSVLSPLSIETREEIAFQTSSLVLYLGDEVSQVQKAEESAALCALPKSVDRLRLNVLNVSAGNRIISPSFICTDAFREKQDSFSGVHSENYLGSLLSTLNKLPFKNESIDAILSLHSLEHDGDPVQTVLNWIDLVKPGGGGIGIILPDFRYTWSARNDHSIFGHKWDPTPELLNRWYEKYWSKHMKLEKLDSYSWKISFDVVLKKHGTHKSFGEHLSNNLPLSGYELNKNNLFPNDKF